MPDEKGAKPWFQDLIDPVVLIAVSILVSIFVLIGAAILGKGNVLADMSTVEYARGLITYLFAVVTIGTAVVLVVSALTSTEDAVHEQRFQRGKEVLSLLLGVFGTIVGFYFGSEVSQGQRDTSRIQVAPLHLSATSVPAGGKLTLETYVSGGHSPYEYSIRVDDQPFSAKAAVDDKGWLGSDVTIPLTVAGPKLEVTVEVQDRLGHLADQTASVAVIATTEPHK